MKRAKISAIVAILVTCPQCKELCCSKDTGAQTITDEDKTVICEYCGTEYLVPSNAFAVKKNK